MPYTTSHINNILELYNNSDDVEPKDLEFNYIALGDDNTPATPNDTALGNELFRKQITQKSKLTQSVRSIISILEAEGNGFDIYEIGLYANATSTPDSGILISRIVVDTPLPKTDGNILNITRFDEVIEGV